jgi:hypothetical protein
MGTQSYSDHRSAPPLVVNTINWSQNVDLGVMCKSITIFANNAVMIRFDNNADAAGNRTIYLRENQSKSFDRTVRLIYFAKINAADPDATVDVDGLF